MVLGFGVAYSPNVGSGSSAGDGGNSLAHGKGSGYEVAVTAANLGVDGLSLGIGSGSIE